MMFYLKDDLSGCPNIVIEDQEDFARLIFMLSVYYMFKYVLNED